MMGWPCSQWQNMRKLLFWKGILFKRSLVSMMGWPCSQWQNISEVVFMQQIFLKTFLSPGYDWGLPCDQQRNLSWRSRTVIFVALFWVGVGVGGGLGCGVWGLGTGDWGRDQLLIFCETQVIPWTIRGTRISTTGSSTTRISTTGNSTTGC